MVEIKPVPKQVLLKRWRLILGQSVDEQFQQSQDSVNAADAADTKRDHDIQHTQLSVHEQKQDQLLQEIYQSSHHTSKHLRFTKESQIIHAMTQLTKHFPNHIADIIQTDALKKLDIVTLLSNPQLAETLQPTLDIVSHILQISDHLPPEALIQAKILVENFVQRMLKQFRPLVTEAIQRHRHGHDRHHRPQIHEIDWSHTIIRNLKHYQPKYQTIIPQQVISKRIKKNRLQELVICVDRSGSMFDSLIHAVLFASILSHVPSVYTSLIAFDTEVYDLSESLYQQNQVDLLFQMKAGGGTDIAQALSYCTQKISSPQQCTLVLISDLYEGGSQKKLLKEIYDLKQLEVTFMVLLALDQEGEPSYHLQIAQQCLQLQIPVFSCMPNVFPHVIAHILNGRTLDAYRPQKDLKFIQV